MRPYEMTILIMNAIVLNLKEVGLTDEQFFNLCKVNENWNLERTAQGELIIMPPVGGESGCREADLITDLNIWNRQQRLGIVFSSSTIFSLPNGGDRSPDAAWIKSDRLTEIINNYFGKSPLEVEALFLES